MTREEQNRKLKAFITCLKCEVSGKSCDDNCPTQYEAGNMGEIIENLETIAKALEQEPSYNSVNSLVESKLKNPKAKTFDILHFVADNAGLSTFEAIEKAYNMGVSEQEPIIDKIRAEIEVKLAEPQYQHEEEDWRDGLIIAETIIDEYKAESEG